MSLPKFLLADNSKYPEDIFVLHTEYPRLLINLKDDSIEFFEDISDENEEDLATEVSNLIEAASSFYDEELRGYDQ